jgi:hypothetical protein
MKFLHRRLFDYVTKLIIFVVPCANTMLLVKNWILLRRPGHILRELFMGGHDEQRSTCSHKWILYNFAMNVESFYPNACRSYSVRDRAHSQAASVFGYFLPEYPQL